MEDPRVLDVGDLRRITNQWAFTVEDEAVVLDLEVADEVGMSKAELLEHLSKASEGGVRTQGAVSSLAGHNN